MYKYNFNLILHASSPASKYLPQSIIEYIVINILVKPT